MKVKVISVFRDKFTGKYYTPGEVIEVGEEARVLDIPCSDHFCHGSWR